MKIRAYIPESAEDFYVELDNMMYDLHRKYRGKGLSDVDVSNIFLRKVEKMIETDPEFADIAPDDCMDMAAEYVYKYYDDYDDWDRVVRVLHENPTKYKVISVETLKNNEHKTSKSRGR